MDVKTGFDIRQSKVGGTGIGRYTDNIYNKLKKSDHGDIVFIDGPANEGNRIIDKLRVNLWEQMILPLELIKNKVKVFHITKNVGIPFLSTAKFVITIHDIIPLILQKEYLQGRLKKLLYLARLKWAVKRAEIIVTDSQYTKKDLIEKLGIDESKIRVVYLGIEEKFRVIDDKENIEKVKSKYGINKPYILGIGSNEPRKNTKSLINAFKILKERTKADLQLVIVGKPWHNLKEINYCNDGDLIFTGYIPDEDLITLYNGTEVFVFPSKYEGFGLPPLEAMACGAPVIASNASSLPELLGDCALLVEPEDVNGLAESILRLVENEELRMSLRKKGLEHVKQFTWEKTTQELLNIYRSCYQNKGKGNA